MSEQNEIAGNAEATESKSTFDKVVAGFLSFFNIFDKIVMGFFSVIIVIGTLGLVAILTWAILARYVFITRFLGFEELLILLACWLYFAGAAYGAFNNTHIAVSIVDSYMQDCLLKRLLIFIRWLITASVCGLFVYYAYDFFMFNFLGPLGDFRFQPTSQVWRIPMWTSVLAIFVGFIFMEIYFIRNMIISGKELFRRTPVPQQEPLRGEN